MINNVVDITNYVLMECGQPLHAFDLAKLAGRQIIVRQRASRRDVRGDQSQDVHARRRRCASSPTPSAPVALGGVMGGADTEVSSRTRPTLLIESAEFDPLSIRTTARKLNLHSDSSYRFERGVDPAGHRLGQPPLLRVDPGTGRRRAGRGRDRRRRASPREREPVTLRFAQLKRVLGIDVAAGRSPARFSRRSAIAKSSTTTQPRRRSFRPVWRRDLTREIDLVEEVARIHGYDKIPEDVSVPMAPVAPHATPIACWRRCGSVLTAAGFDEAMTLSAVEEPWSEAFSPWTDAAPLRASTPVLRRADRLRRSLVPSLLGARQTNESLANPGIELFEIAHVYLPRGGGEAAERRADARAHQRRRLPARRRA